MHYENGGRIHKAKIRHYWEIISALGKQKNSNEKLLII